MTNAITRRTLVAASLGFGLASPVVHAQRSAPDSVSGPVLRIVAPWDLRGLDPARAGFVFQRLSIAENLVTTDLGGRLQPQIATDWTVTGGGLEWRFPIRPGRRFHDGTQLSPAAAANALTIARSATGNVLTGLPILAITNDDSSVIFRLSRPFALLPAYLASASTIILAPSCYGADGQVRQVIGSGAYRVTRIDGALVVETEAAVTADGALPSVRRVQYRAVADGETRARFVEAGDAEVAFNLQPVAADRLRRARQITVVAVPIPRSRFVALNAALPIFADPRVRQALSLAIDRAGAARAILRNPMAAADQLLPPFLKEWRAAEIKALETSPTAAARLLDEAGWRVGPDKIRMRDGNQLSFELFTYAARPELPALAEAMQAQWRDIGVEARIRLGDSEEIPQMRASGKLEAALVARNYALVPDPVGTLAEDFVPPASNGYGSIGWRSELLEAAIETYRVTADPEVQATARHQITTILQTELPVIPHSWYDQIVAFSERLDGGAVDPYELSYGIEKLRWAAA